MGYALGAAMIGLFGTMAWLLTRSKMAASDTQAYPLYLLVQEQKLGKKSQKSIAILPGTEQTIELSAGTLILGVSFCKEAKTASSIVSFVGFTGDATPTAMLKGSEWIWSSQRQLGSENVARKGYPAIVIHRDMGDTRVVNLRWKASPKAKV